MAVMANYQYAKRAIQSYWNNQQKNGVRGERHAAWPLEWGRDAPGQGTGSAPIAAVTESPAASNH